MTIFIVGLMLGFTSGLRLQKYRIENSEDRLRSNEERVKLLETKLGGKDLKIQNLEEELSSLRENRQVGSTLDLDEYELKSLIAIKKFEDNNPIKPPQPPPEYSVDQLAKDLGVESGKASAILEKFRRLGLFGSIWDGMMQFTSTNRPMNEVKSGRLSEAGKDLVKKHSNDD